MKKKLTQILALILAGALVLTTLVSIAVSAAYGEEAEPVREQKILLLKRLVEVALAYRDSAEVGYLLTKALFALGESWETEWVKVLVKEADGYLVSKEDY